MYALLNGFVWQMGFLYPQSAFRAGQQGISSVLYGVIKRGFPSRKNKVHPFLKTFFFYTHHCASSSAASTDIFEYFLLVPETESCLGLKRNPGSVNPVFAQGFVCNLEAHPCPGRTHLIHTRMVLGWTRT